MKTTESSSLYDSLETKSTLELLQEINAEYQKVALAVQKEISKIQAFVDEAFKRFKQGGRVFFIGAGTTGSQGGVVG
jgi:N-acetylmuramic acid 6-phosphate etherase